jgi:hypothetical protein
MISRNLASGTRHASKARGLGEPERFYIVAILIVPANAFVSK